ncbi:MAG: type II toxin-antitoxin system HicA family toxin [Propionibacteriaceae bacterium]|nr:type II toxin-antitoxin system HicA family toxin [Propionibacteriaceae bacterium]
MTKPMKYRDLVRLLKQAGFSFRQGKGDHEVWYGPNKAEVVLVKDTECSPGITREALKAIKKAKEA